ncbi:MAG: hypothetical protein ACI3ZB_00845 [Prevotella sp.]
MYIGKLGIVLTMAVLTLMMSCRDSGQVDSRKGHLNDELKLKGDMTVYGLACEGCSDSVIVLLPNDGRDPVRYDIIDAMRNGKVLGKPKVGDWMGLVVNSEDSTVADIAIDLDQLKGTWCYIVMPKMRDYEKMSKRMQERMERNMPDSVKATYMIPREYGFSLKRQWTASSVGYVREQSSLADESPVVYPQLSYFTEWHIWNGKLVMTSGTPDLESIDKEGSLKLKDVRLDTCDIVYLRDDSLVLASDGVQRSYYRQSAENNINKKAQQMIEKLTKEALQATTGE